MSQIVSPLTVGLEVSTYTYELVACAISFAKCKFGGDVPTPFAMPVLLDPVPALSILNRSAVVPVAMLVYVNPVGLVEDVTPAVVVCQPVQDVL